MRLSAALALLAAASGCADLTGAGEVRTDLESQSTAVESSIRETEARGSLGQIENAIASYLRGEGHIPQSLEDLVPKYLGSIPPLDIPACGRRTEGAQNYPAAVLRDGQVDGSRLKGTGRWGYVHDESRVIVFVDCLKPSSSGAPWYRVRGVF